MNYSLLKRTLIALFITICCFNLTAVIVVYGDSRSQPEIHAEIVKQLARFNPTAVFHTGDMNSNGMRQTEYDNFFATLKPVTDKGRFYPVKGNHEKNLELYLANFPQLNNQTYYTVIEDSITWIILDTTMKIGPGSPQYKWLQSTLEEHKATPMIVLMHHPIFSSGEHGDELGLSLFLPALFNNYPVLATFCAHDHMYERSEFKGRYYIVSGGAGAPLYREESYNPYSKKIFLGHNFCILEFKNVILNVKVYNLKSELIDEFKSVFKQPTKE